MELYSSYLGMNLAGGLEFWMGLPPICQRMKGKDGLKRDENASVSALAENKPLRGDSYFKKDAAGKSRCAACVLETFRRNSL